MSGRISPRMARPRTNPWTRMTTLTAPWTRRGRVLPTAARTATASDPTTTTMDATGRMRRRWTSSTCWADEFDSSFPRRISALKTFMKSAPIRPQGTRRVRCPVHCAGRTWRRRRRRTGRACRGRTPRRCVFNARSASDWTPSARLRSRLRSRRARRADSPRRLRERHRLRRRHGFGPRRKRRARLRLRRRRNALKKRLRRTRRSPRL